MTRSRLVLVVLLSSFVALPACADKNGAAVGGGTESAAPHKEEGTAAVVAYVNGEAITGETLDAKVQAQLMDLRQKEYDLRVAALKQVVDQTLFEAEAVKRGISVADLVVAEVEAKAAKPSEQEKDDYYQKYRSRVRTLQKKSREEAGPELDRILTQQKLAQRRQAFLEELRAGADVRILLDPPRVDVTVPAGEPSRGPADAPIVFVEFSDFQCPYCKSAEKAVDRILAEYGDRIHFVYRDFPLRFHQRATPAAVAARCAGDQGKYWDYHRNLMTEDGSLEDDDLRRRAESVGLEMATFNACLDGNRHAPAVETSFQEGASLGVTGTPTFFINGRRLVGAQPYEAIKEVVEDELRRSGADSTPVGG